MSDSYPEALKNLIASFSRLPGVGPKTAQRLSFFLIKSLPDEIEGLINSLTEVKQKIHFCSRCGFYTENELCSICQDSTRESTIPVSYTHLDVYKRQPTLSARVMPLIVLDGELAVPCTCNPLQQGRIPKPGIFLLVSVKKSGVEDWVLRDKSP